MKRGQREFNIGAFAQKALLVTILAALVEIPIVYFFAAYKNAPVVAAENPATTQAKAEAFSKKNHPSISEVLTLEPQNNTVSDTATTATPPEIVKAQITTMPPPDTTKVQQLPMQKKVDTLVKKPSPKAKVDTSKLVRLVKTEKPLTDEIMLTVLNSINQEKEKRNMSSRCVKVRTTRDSNVPNALKIADYLKAKGFIISGREVVSKSHKGVLVTAAGDCLVLSIGTL